MGQAVYTAGTRPVGSQVTTIGQLSTPHLFVGMAIQSEGVMDDESGESMEPMEEVPLIQLGEAELERLVRG